jgi:type IV secretion system protein VirB5
MKRSIAVAMLAMSGLADTSMAQGTPVFDAASFAQAIQQIAAWKQQAEQMSSQLKQLEDQNAALTGSRGLGAILSNPELRATVPADAAQLFQALRTGGAGSLTAQAASIRSASKTYDCENRSGADRTTCEAFLNNSAQSEAFQQNAMLRLNQRMDQINGLQGRINATNDPKSIAELTARLVAESAQVANDANKILILKAMSDSADRAAQQALKERELLSLSRTGDGSDTFVYKPYVAQ